MTRHNEKNCHLQCKFCNNNSEKGRKGEQFKMGLYINKTYGPGTAEELMEISRCPGKRLIDYESLIKFYKQKTKEFK